MFTKMLNCVFHSPGHERLAAAILEMSERVKWTDGIGSRGSQLLESATKAMQQGRVLLAWDCLHQLERLLLETLHDDELIALATTLSVAAPEKLSRWRRKACDALLGSFVTDPHLKKSQQRVAVLREVLNHLHTESQNMQLKLAELRARLRVLATLLFVVLGALLVLGYTHRLDIDFWHQLRAIVFGFMGGVISLAVSVTRTNPVERIPRLRSSFEVTLMRPLVGAMSGMIVVMLGDGGLLPLNTKTATAALAIAFVAGFSERWFLGLFQKYDTKSSPESGSSVPNALPSTRFTTF